MRATVSCLLFVPALAFAGDPAPVSVEAPAAPAAPSEAPAAPAEAVAPVAPVAPVEAPAVPAAPAATDGASLWAGRVDAAVLEKALAAFEAEHKANPTDRKALQGLVRGWYFYGDAFTDDVPTKLERWQKAIDAGNACLALNADFKGRVDGGEKEKDAAVVMNVDDVPCLYWTSTALGKWAKAQSLSLTLKHLPTVKAYMTKVDELDPTFFNYGPARYWAAYNAALPSFAGKDLVKSEEYFKASIEGAPDYLATRVLRAEFLAVQKQDLKAFEEDLNWVIAADPNKLPECTPENIKEQEKAQKLLAKKSDLFAGATPAADAPAEGKKKNKGK